MFESLVQRIRDVKDFKNEQRETQTYFKKSVEHELRGSDFFTYGVSVAKRIHKSDPKLARPLFSVPVDTTRFFEFDYARRMLKPFESSKAAFLDVSSPFLFSFWVAEHFANSSVQMVNPDSKDLQAVKKRMTTAEIPRLKVEEATVKDLQKNPEASFDAVWSLSVVEHIYGEEIDDSSSLKIMWAQLKPGGLLILTVPTDKTFWEEYRSEDTYGQIAQHGNEPVFFQRFYDEASIRNRLIEPLGVEPESIEWFGGKQVGVFHDMIEGRLSGKRALGPSHMLDMATSYETFPTFDSMPGEGVCGLCFRKPSKEAAI